MIYLWLKALHLIAVILWLTGLAATVYASFNRDAVGVQIQRFNRRVGTPAMLAVWALGIALAQQAGWWDAGWLQAKLILVVVLSGVYGFLSGRLGREGGLPFGKHPATLLMLLPVLIIILVIVKPL